MTRKAALALLLAAAIAPAAAADDYRLQQGDVLELVVITPPLREQMRIDIDGNVTLPVVGTLAAEGRSLAAVAAEARERLAAATLPPMAPVDALPARIWPSAVSLGLREYRPIYVGGEVRAAGAFPFWPGLTARRAIVLAGGAGRMPDGEFRHLELEGALAELKEKRAAAAARLHRLRLELNAGASPAARLAALPETEGAILALRRDQDAAAGAHYATAIRHTRAQIEDLAAQLANETEGMAADREDYQRIADMREAGTATALRLSDTRRALLFSTTRQLQTATELARTTRELGSVEYERLRRTLDRRMEAQADAAAAARLAAELDARIAATRRQLAWLGRATAGDTPVVVSVTDSAGAVAALASGEDRPLRPGDLVTVSFVPEPPTD